MAHIVTCMVPQTAVEVTRENDSGRVFQVVCTGKEERLLDCDFPQDFGVDYDFSYFRDGSEGGPAPGGGLPNSNCVRNDNRRLGVICRRFEITGAPLLTLHCSPAAPWLELHVEFTMACRCMPFRSHVYDIYKCWSCFLHSVLFHSRTVYPTVVKIEQWLPGYH